MREILERLEGETDEKKAGAAPQIVTLESRAQVGKGREGGMTGYMDDSICGSR